MSKTPSFRYMGGKSRLRKWLISHFPKIGNNYLEPFCGLGNVFFESKKSLNFKKWNLTDINPSFLVSLIKVNLENLPEKVNKNDFEFWKNSKCDVSKVIEPKITFAGKGYSAGFDGGHPSHPPYSGKLHKKTCEIAKQLLSDVAVFRSSWEEINYDSLDENDFVYFDPPYFETKASYPNIDHFKLIETLNKLKCKWALSGYDNKLYQCNLIFKNKYEKIRNSEIKSSNFGKYQSVNEILWMNY